MLVVYGAQAYRVRNPPGTWKSHNRTLRVTIKATDFITQRLGWVCRPDDLLRSNCSTFFFLTLILKIRGV